MNVSEETFSSVPEGDKYQKILGWGLGIKMTPAFKGERKTSNPKIGLVQGYAASQLSDPIQSLLLLKPRKLHMPPPDLHLSTHDNLPPEFSAHHSLSFL